MVLQYHRHLGETLSLAAAKATITAYKKYNVIEHLWKQGKKLWGTLNGIFEKYDVPIQVKGLWPCPIFVTKDGAQADTISRFLSLSYKNGVSLYNVSYVNYSHKDEDIEETLQKLEKACAEFQLLIFR